MSDQSLKHERDDESITINGKRLALFVAVCGVCLPICVTYITGIGTSAGAESRTVTTLSQIQSEMAEFRELRKKRDDFVADTRERLGRIEGKQELMIQLLQQKEERK